MKKFFCLIKRGQLGNQLSILAHLIAFSKEYDYQIIFPESKELSGILKYNSGDYKNPAIIFKPFTGNYRLINIIKILKFHKSIENFNLRNILIINSSFNVDHNIPFKSPKLIFLSDWLFRYYSGVQKHEEYIRATLAFKQELIVESDKFIKIIKRKNPSKILIGVHVRRGDYLTWQDGKYYFEDSDYYSKMAEIAVLISGSIFVVTSNEPIQFDNYNSYPIYYCKGSAIEDLNSLSHCDYIMGPPSTFSGWASFIGNTPLYFIENKDKIKSMNLFKPYFL